MLIELHRRTSVVHALTHAGKVYAELTITGMAAGRFMVVTGSGVEGHDLRHMTEVAREGEFDVAIDNVTDDLNVLRDKCQVFARFIAAPFTPHVDFEMFLLA